MKQDRLNTDKDVNESAEFDASYGPYGSASMKKPLQYKQYLNATFSEQRLTKGTNRSDLE